ncbi:MAG: cytochrome b/b6 domain-containing protein [Fidelibacterota bacterium]
MMKDKLRHGQIPGVGPAIFLSGVVVLFLWTTGPASGQELESIDETSCMECHEEGARGTVIQEDLEGSSHQELGCLDCHRDKDTVPHREETGFFPGSDACRDCHQAESDEYRIHGRFEIGEAPDLPSCSDCHGDHDIRPSSENLSRVHPANLPTTCGQCHEDLNLTQKYEMLLDHPVELYESSIHGRVTKGGIYAAATCIDCHATGSTAHRIYSAGHPESTVNHFNIPTTCGQCHEGIRNDFWEGIHGKLVKRGETDAPVCTSCHGEHGILSPRDPRSPVSPTRVVERTCSPCHESTRLNERYGLPVGRLVTFIDSYHGLKSKAGDVHVANCASCHGVHRILPSTDPTSTIFPANLQRTCGECHPGISEELAATPIHGIGGERVRAPAADVVEKIYIVAIIVIIGLMAIHWIIDLLRQIRLVMAEPQVRRMRLGEVWQHTLLMLSFLVLVISGFALRFSQSWITTLFFGWERGFALRGTVHRVAAVIFILTALWHLLFLFSPRGKAFIKDVWPKIRDFKDFWQRILYNLGRVPTTPQFGRFSYIEKAEYWALVWGTVIMIVTGLVLWFDNYVVQFLPKGVIDVALVIHYWEAWLATLAVAVWHLWSTVFNPHVYPMNPSWLTGTMPEDMYEHEHPRHVAEAKEETKAWIRGRSGKTGEHETE